VGTRRRRHKRSQQGSEKPVRLEVKTRKSHRARDVIIVVPVGKTARVKVSSVGTRGIVGEWLSLVEHLVRDQGVGGSNPLSPTNLSKHCSCTTFSISSIHSLFWIVSQFVPTPPLDSRRCYSVIPNAALLGFPQRCKFVGH
jgi:hypothetical protein